MGNHRDGGGYRYSYSGADCKAFAFRNNETYGKNETKLFLESLQTISFSIHEAKGQARALGHKNVKGFSRSIRQIAGTMIFTVIEDHPLAGLMKRSTPSWSVDNSSGRGVSMIGELSNKYVPLANKLATLIAPFDLMLIYTTEMVNPGAIFQKPLRTENSDAIDDTINGTGREKYNDFDTPGKSVSNYTSLGELSQYYSGNSAGLVIKGIEIITEGIVTSVNDMITEIQIQFVARDVNEFSLDQWRLDSNIDITYDEAFEYMKNIYKESDIYTAHENLLRDYERELEASVMGMSADTFAGKYPGVAFNTNAVPGIDSNGNVTYGNAVVNYADFKTEHILSGFTYDETTGEYKLTSSTVNNPILFDD